MGIDAIGNSTNTQRLQLAAPASPQAVPVETARAEVNAASLLTGMMAPTPDGIYTIGAVSVKGSNAIKPIAKTENWGSWGFYILAIMLGGVLSASSPAYAHHHEGWHHHCGHGDRHHGHHYHHD